MDLLWPEGEGGSGLGQRGRRDRTGRGQGPSPDPDQGLYVSILYVCTRITGNKYSSAPWYIVYE